MNFSVILVTLPSIILPSAIFFVFESWPFKFFKFFEALVSKELYILLVFYFFFNNIFNFKKHALLVKFMLIKIDPGSFQG